jgi:hypothetical protein
VKNLIFILGIFFFGSNAFGQDLPDNSKINWTSTSETNLRNHTVHKVILKTKNEYLIAQRHLRHEIGKIPTLPVLQRYDYNLKLLNSLNLKTLDLPKKVMYEDILPLSNRLYLFYSKYDKKDAGKIIYTQELDKNDLKPIGKPRLLARGNSKLKTSFFTPKPFLKRLSFHFSPDSSKLMIVEMVNNHFKRKNELIVNIFDQELKLLWKKSHILHEGKMDVLNYRSLVDNKGNAHFLLTREKKEKWSVFAVKTFAVNQIISIHGADEEIITKKISLPGYLLHGPGMILTKDNKLFITGFYSEKQVNNSSLGSYVLLLSPSDHTTLFENRLKFGADFISEKLFTQVGKKRKKNDKSGSSFYYVKDLFLKGNGNVTVIGEMEEHMDFTPVAGVDRPGINPEVFFLKDIAVIEFLANGERNWITKVKKRQFSVNDNGIFSSYHASLINDDIYILFNDHADEVRQKDSKQAGAFKNRSTDKYNVLSLVKVKNNGIQSRYGISYFLNTNLVARPAIFSLTDHNELLLYEHLKENYRFGILNFDKNFSYRQ